MTAFAFCLGNCERRLSTIPRVAPQIHGRNQPELLVSVLVAGFRKTRAGFFLKSPTRVGFLGFIGFLDAQCQRL